MLITAFSDFSLLTSHFPGGISLATLMNAPITGVILSTLGVLKAYHDHKKARAKTLQQYSISWLYLATPPRISLNKTTLF